MNALIEEAKENGEDLWLLFQDMKKAFDSVPLEGLRLALKRIKLPEITIKFIMNLFEERQFRVITAEGLSKKFKAGDGIDQREVLSPLVW